MNGFLYGIALQWKLDLRSKTMLLELRYINNYITGGRKRQE